MAVLLACGGLLACSGHLGADEVHLQRMLSVEEVEASSVESFETALADGETDLAKRLASV